MKIIAIFDDGEGFYTVLELASRFGWVDTHGNASSGDGEPRDADECEADALDYLESKDVTVITRDQLITGVLGKPEPAFPELGGKSLASTVHTAPGESVIEKVMELPNKWEPDSGWDDHPVWPREDWAYECAANDTCLGYVDWVNAQIDAWEDK